MKKLNKLFAILVAMAMILSLAAVSAFAVTPELEVNDDGTKVAKKLTMPKDVAPTGTITINATLNSIDGVPVTTTSTDNTGKIASQDINLASGWIKKDGGTATDVYYYATPNVFLADDYHGGVYKYTITETYDAWKTANETAYEGATATGSDKSYEMTVNVNSNGEPTQVFVGTGTNKQDLYETIDNTNVEAAVANGVSFENTVTQVSSSDNYNDSKLKATKVVEAADANDIADKDTGFKFHVTLTLPDITGTDVAKYVIYDASKDTTSAEVSVSTDADGFDVYLAHNDQLYFTSIPVGAYVTITETDGRVGTEASQTYTKKAGSVELTNETVDAENALEAKVTNVHKTTDTTGILMSNLPYIVLALVAIGGMVAYVVVRRRNADEA